MSDLQERIATWIRAIDPVNGLDVGERYSRAADEMDEWKGTSDTDETADVVITLYGYAAARGFDLERAVEDKFRRAQDKYGFKRHELPTDTNSPFVNWLNGISNSMFAAGLLIPAPAPNVLEAERPSVDATWYAVAETVAKRGTCTRKQVGACIIDADGVIVSTGYNGAPRGLPHCLEVGCINDTEDHARCKRAVHAEANAIIQGGQYDCQDATLYVTTFPCIECAQLIINAGISRVVFGGEYATQAHFRSVVEDLFDAADVQYGSIENAT